MPTLMEQAIVTKYMRPTDTKGARVRAENMVGYSTMQWCHEFDEAKNHTLAALKLAEQCGYRHTSGYRLVSAPMPKSDDFCHIFVKIA